MRQQLPLLRFPAGKPGSTADHPVACAGRRGSALPREEGIPPVAPRRRGASREDGRGVHRRGPAGDLPRNGDADPPRERRPHAGRRVPGVEGGRRRGLPVLPGDVPPGDLCTNAPFRSQGGLRMAHHLHGPRDPRRVRRRRDRRPPGPARLPVRSPRGAAPRGAPARGVRRLSAHDLRAAVQACFRRACRRGPRSGVGRRVRADRDPLSPGRSLRGGRRVDAGTRRSSGTVPRHRRVPDQRRLEDRSRAATATACGGTSRSSSRWTTPARSRKSSASSCGGDTSPPCAPAVTVGAGRGTSSPGWRSTGTSRNSVFRTRC